jgi:hypothetical protein
MNPARRYDYNLPWRGAVIGGLFYAGLSVLIVHLARDVSGVVFVGFIALSAMFAVLAVFMMMRRLVFPRALEFTEDAVLFPHGFPRTRITRIPYTDIIRMRDAAVASSDSFCMVTGRGSFEIGAAHLHNMDSYHAVKDFICSKSSIVMTRLDKIGPACWRIWGFPEPILRWVEPADWPRYRTHLVVSKPLLPRLAKALWCFARCFGVILLAWLLLQLFQIPTISISGFLWLAIPVTLFFTSLHWLTATYPVHPTEISFRERGITQFFGKQTWDLNYAYFSSWAVVERQFEGRALHILLLQGRSRVFEFALPDTNTCGRLAQIFHDKQIPHSPDLKPSWESRA